MIDNHCKSVLKPAKLVYATKTKESVSCQKLGSWNFWQTVNGVLNKGKSALRPLLNSPEVFTSASDQAKLSNKNLSQNSNLEDSGISLPFSLLELIWNCILFL